MTKTQPWESYDDGKTFDRQVASHYLSVSEYIPGIWEWSVSVKSATGNTHYYGSCKTTHQAKISATKRLKKYLTEGR